MQSASATGQRLKYAAQATLSAALNSAQSVQRDELMSAARKAQQALKLGATERLVLAEMVVCHPKAGQGAPIVCPSNARLLMKVGGCDRNLRAVIDKLVERNLIRRKDSANRKRFMRRKADGSVEIYGFDLSLVYERRAEWDRIIEERERERSERADRLAEIGICRRMIRETIEWLAHSSQTNTDGLVARFEHLVARTPAKGTAKPVEAALLDLWAELRTDALRAYADSQTSEPAEIGENDVSTDVSAPRISANDGDICQHIEQNTNLSNEVCNKGIRAIERTSAKPQHNAQAIEVSAIIEACPTLSSYVSPIRNISDLIRAGHYLRPSLGAHPSIWSEGVSSIGASLTAAAVIYTLQKYEDDVASGRNEIENPGGYLRSIIRDIGSGRLDLKLALSRLRSLHVN